MRLIDADKLIMDLSDYALQESPNDNMDDEEKDFQSQIYAAIMFCIDFVEQTKTAYDVDKVAEELEKLADENYKAYCIAFNSDDRAEYDAYTNAIEIVKQGGVSDDVCEWKQTSTAVYRTSCGYKLEEYFETNACYCKQCGKKIKVVEQWRD